MSETAAPTRIRCPETKKDGQPCTAWATYTGKCAGHSHLGVSANPVANQARATEAKRTVSERKRKAAELAAMSPKQRLERLASDEATNMATTFQDAMRTGSLEDLRRAQAAELLLSRVYGRPTERVETTPVAPVLEELAAMSPEQRAALLASVAGGKRLRLVDDTPEAQAS